MGNIELPGGATGSKQTLKMPVGTYEFGANLISEKGVSSVLLGKGEGGRRGEGGKVEVHMGCVREPGQDLSCAADAPTRIVSLDNVLVESSGASLHTFAAAPRTLCGCCGVVLCFTLLCFMLCCPVPAAALCAGPCDH